MKRVQDFLDEESDYWRRIAAGIGSGLLLVAILGVVLGASSFSPEGPKVFPRHADGSIIISAFALLLTAVVSLQILTRLPVLTSKQAGEPRSAEAVRMARRRVLASIAMLLTPTSLAVGLYGAWPSIMRFTAKADVVGVFAPLLTALLIAVFAADASLASDEDIDATTLANVSRHRVEARIQLEIDVLRHGIEEDAKRANPSRSRRFIGWTARWGAYVLPSLAYILLIILWNPMPTAQGAIVAGAVVATPLVGVFAVQLLGFVVRRDWVSAFLIGIGGFLYALLLIVSMSASLLPDDAPDLTFTVAQFFLGVTFIVLAFIVPALSAALSLLVFFGKYPGALRRRAIRSAQKRLQRTAKTKEETPQSAEKASWYAWSSLALTLVLAPLAAFLAVVILVDHRTTRGSRKVAVWTIILSVIVAAAVLIWLSTAFARTEWDDPFPF